MVHVKMLIQKSSFRFLRKKKMFTRHSSLLLTFSLPPYFLCLLEEREKEIEREEEEEREKREREEDLSEVSFDKNVTIQESLTSGTCDGRRMTKGFKCSSTEH